MEFSTGFGWTRLPLLAAAFILGSVLTVSAQIIPPFSPAAAAPDDEAETEPAEAADVNDADVLKGIDVDKLDWSQLAVDAGTGIDPMAADIYRYLTFDEIESYTEAAAAAERPTID